MDTSTDETRGNDAVDAATGSDPLGGRGAKARLAPGVELLGRYRDSGLTDPPYLARRPDGQVVQLAELPYQIAAATDGRRDPHQIAEHVSDQAGRVVTADNVREVIAYHLHDLGIVEVDGVPMTTTRSRPLLSIGVRRAVVPAGITESAGSRLAFLFRPGIVLGALAAVAAFDVWLFGLSGMAQPVRDLLLNPVLLLAAFGLIVLAAVFHELGHAAGACHGGARPGRIGIGLYVVWPVIYTDLTDTYRLDRRGRLRADMGGIYFNMLFVLGVAAAYWLTGMRSLLVVVGILHLQALYQLLPILRLDGHYIISDLVGVPDILSRVRPVLARLLPWNWRRPAPAAVAQLRPWARRVTAVYSIVVAAVFSAVVLMLLINAPRVFATAALSFSHHLAAAGGALDAGRPAAAGAASLQLASLVLPALGILVTGSRLLRAAAHAVAAWTSGSLPRQSAAAAIGVGGVVLLAFLWWPSGQYQPIGPEERGVVADAAAQYQRIPVAEHPAGPAIAVRGTASEGGGHVTAVNEGDRNVAVARNTRSGSDLFVLSFALATVMDGIVDQQNIAIAISECRRCSTFAVAVQVVLVMTAPHVVRPQNLAIASNSGCRLCTTVAVAHQLVFGYGEHVRLTPEGRLQLRQIVVELRALRHQRLTASQLRQRMRAIARRLRYVFEHHVEPVDESEGEATAQPETPPEDDTVEDVETPPADATDTTDGAEEQPTEDTSTDTTATVEEDETTATTTE